MRQYNPRASDVHRKRPKSVCQYPDGTLSLQHRVPGVPQEKMQRRPRPQALGLGRTDPKDGQRALTHPMSSHAHTTVSPLTFLRGQGGVAPLCTPVRTTNASESARSDLSRGPEDLRARCKRFGSSKISKTKNRNFSPIRSTKRTFRGLCTPAPPPRTGRPRAAVGAHPLDLLHPPALKFPTSHIVFPTSHDSRLRSGPGPRAP